MAVEWQEVTVRRRQTERQYGRPSWVVSLGLVGFMLLVTGVPLALWSVRVIPDEAALGRIIVAGMLGLFVLMAAGLVWINLRPRRGPTPYPSIVLAGPPSPAAVARARAEVELRERPLLLARAGAAREAHERATRVARAGILGPANLITLILVFLLVVVSATAELSRFGGGVTGYSLTYGVPVVVFGLLLLLVLGRRAHARAVRARLTPLRSWLGGHPHTSYADTVAWLNEYWPAPTTPEDAYATRHLVSVAGVRGGYPVMVELEPRGRHDEYARYPPRVLVYLAAIPAGTEPPVGGQADRLLGQLQQAGFTVRAEPGAGLLARADPATVARLSADLARLTELRPVISDLAGLAAAEGAVAPPIQPPE